MDNLNVVLFYDEKLPNKEFNNFHNEKRPLVIDGEEWTNTEQYFQALKFRGPHATPRAIEYSNLIKLADSPMKVKMLGTQKKNLRFGKKWKLHKTKDQRIVNDLVDEYADVKMRPDWNQASIAVMINGLEHKFTQYPKLREKLISLPDNSYIVEHTTRDKKWADGGDKGTGEKGTNYLGKILTALQHVLKHGNCSHMSKELKNKIRLSEFIIDVPISPVNMLDAPDDVVFEFMMELDDQALQNFCRSNKQAAALCRDEPFWRERFMKYFDSEEKEKPTWKETYISWAKPYEFFGNEDAKLDPLLGTWKETVDINFEPIKTITFEELGQGCKKVMFMDTSYIKLFPGIICESDDIWVSTDFVTELGNDIFGDIDNRDSEYTVGGVFKYRDRFMAEDVHWDVTDNHNTIHARALPQVVIDGQSYVEISAVRQILQVIDMDIDWSLNNRLIELPKHTRDVFRKWAIMVENGSSTEFFTRLLENDADLDKTLEL